MFKNYFKIAYRNILKNKSVSAINIAGLSFAIAFCLLILFFVQYELNYDKFQKNGADIYRVLLISSDKQYQADDSTPTALGPALIKDYPEIVNVVRFGGGYSIVGLNENQFQETGIVGADESILNMFTFEFLYGNEKEALKEPNSVVLSSELANKYFGKENPVGKTLVLKKNEFKITGVYKDLPSNTSLKIRGIVSGKSDKYLTDMNNHWGNNFTVTYVQLTHNSSPADFEKKMTATFLKYGAKEFGEKFYCKLQPLNRIHLYSKADFGVEESGDVSTVLAYGAISFFLLIIAAINFINISFGQIISRFKEIGLRKMWGADSLQISLQYFFEVILSISISFLLSLVIMNLLLPVFNQLTDRKIEFVLNGGALLSIILMFAFTCVLVGLIPSFMFSKFRIAEILRGTLKFGGAGSLTKKLIVVQFSLTIFFIICTSLISKQIDYAMSMHKISDKTNIIEVSFRRLSSSYKEMLETKGLVNQYCLEAKKSPLMIASTPISAGGGYTNLEFEGKKFMGGVSMITDDYLKIYDNKVIKGRDFDLDKYPSDSVSAVVINESYAKKLNVENPVGKTIKIQNKIYSIIGEIEDRPLRKIDNKIPEQIYAYYNDKLVYMLSCKVKRENEKEALAFLKDKWGQLFNKAPFEASFYDEKWHKEYSKELNSRELLVMVSLFTLTVSSFGIFGLITLSLAKRKRELGIRKVLGASVSGIIFMLSKEFVILIIVSAIIAAPAAYYFMNDWLNNFIYRTNIDLYVFLTSTVIVLMVAVITVGIKSAKTALANPVESIKYE